jgi:hypothetical protein
MLECVFVCFRLCISVSEFCTLNALGSCMVYFSNFTKYPANLYPGLFIQLTMGLMSVYPIDNRSSFPGYKTVGEVKLTNYLQQIPKSYLD